MYSVVQTLFRCSDDLIEHRIVMGYRREAGLIGGWGQVDAFIQHRMKEHLKSINIALGDRIK